MRPVFIGGCDRSGTTLLGAMLGTHSECLCVPESQFIIEVLNGSNFEIDRIDTLAVLDMIKKHLRFKLWGINIDPSSLSPNQPITSYAALIEWIVREYGKANGQVFPNFWIDHTPFNVKYATTLFSIFPNAKLIHLVRDGRAVASSFMSVPWGPKAINKIAYFWLRNLAYGLAAESLYGSTRVLRVKYEDLVSEPETTLKALCSFLDIDYEPQMINGDGFKVPSHTRQDHALVGKGPDNSRVNAWQKKLTSRQIEIFESTTGDMLRHLGYTPIFGVRARNMSQLERLISNLKYLQMLIANLRRRIKLLNNKFG